MKATLPPRPDHAGPPPGGGTGDGPPMPPIFSALDTDGDGVVEASDKLSWTAAQARPAALNAMSYLGYDDWRLPNVKELQSLLDYTRSPGTTASAAIDQLLDVTPLTNEGGEADFPWYWSSTTHANYIGLVIFTASIFCA